MAALALLLALWGPAQAADAVEPAFTWAPPEAASPADVDCPRFLTLETGKPPPAGLIVDGLLTCDATVVPPTDLEYLLRVEAWAQMAAPRGRLLSLDVTWERERADRYKVALEKPPPFIESPTVQRWAGRLETLAVLTLAVVAVRQTTGQ